MSLSERLHETIKRSIENKEVAGVNVSVIQNGKEIAYTECGYRDIEEKKPFDKDTIFRLYSMSKPLTSACAFILVEQGLLDLGEPVANYIEEFADTKVVCGDKLVPQKRPLQISDLLNMTSGLTYGGLGNPAFAKTSEIIADGLKKLRTGEAISTVEFAKKLADAPLLFQPGEHFMYGFSADVLGAVIEVASKKPFAQFMHDNIFAPLHMDDSAFYVPDEKRDRLAKVYDFDNKTKDLKEVKTDNLLINYDCDKNPAFASGGAGVMSTLSDYSKFAKMLLNGGTYEGTTILRPNTVSFMTSGKLRPECQKDMDNSMEHNIGFTYANLLRVMDNPSIATTLSSKGEYGWDGWLGPYFENVPEYNLTILMGMQKINAGTWSLTRKLRNVIFSEL